MPSSQTTRDKLLDAAEALFADSGYHGVSVRDITHAAGARVASINDHFGGKEMLFKAVIARRADLINEDRRALLEDAEPIHEGVDGLGHVVHAFVHPLLTRSEEGEGWKNYLRLISQLSNSRSTVLLLVVDQFNPTVERFIAAIGAAIPSFDERQRGIAYQLMLSSAMAIFSDNCRINVFTSNRYLSADFASHYADLIGYITGGILGMAHPWADCAPDRRRDVRFWNPQSSPGRVNET